MNNHIVDRVLYRYAGVIEPPPKMVKEITEWLEQVMYAKQVVKLYDTYIDFNNDAVVAEYEETMSAAIALKQNPVSWKAYKALMEFVGFSFGNQMKFSDFTKLTPEGKQALVERCSKIAEVTLVKYNDLLQKAKGEKEKLKNVLEDVKGKITDSSVIRYGKVGVYITSIKTFPVDLTGWKPNPAFTSIIVNADDKTMPANSGASWQETTRMLSVKLPAYVDEKEIARMQRLVKHELRHFMQSYMSSITGHGDTGWNRAPRPGMPSKKIMTPTVNQSYLRDRWKGQLMPKDISNGINQMQTKNIYPSEVHDLDDVEFYTELADAIEDCKVGLKKTKDDPNTYIKKFTGEIKSDEIDKFFSVLKRHAPGKWRKAVGELVKAVL